MSGFATLDASLEAAPADPTKHVNYTLGMVLGVDDFTQEFAYLSGRDQWLARDLVGYGTVSGLALTVDPPDPTGARPQRVRVGAGVALSPRGQLICVPADQCAYLDAWVEANGDRLPAGDPLRLYVVLCYRDCPTDDTPIPGEPCRSEDELMAPSRRADGFHLELRPDPPDQREEESLRDFVAWLRRVAVTDDPEAATDLGAFEAALEEAAEDAASPLDFMFGSPPDELRMLAGELCAYLQAAFRFWVTRLRPRWRPSGAGCALSPDEGCLLLGELELALTADRRAVRGLARASEGRRPFLVHARMLQEWLLCGQERALPGDTVAPALAFGLPADAGVAPEYSRADHTHGTPPDPIPDHVADDQAHLNHQIRGDVTRTLADSEVVGLRGLRLPDLPEAAEQRWLSLAGGEGGPEWRLEPPPAAPPLAGDLSVSGDQATVIGLRSTPIRDQALTPRINNGDLLTYRDGQWQAEQAPSGGTPTPLTGDLSVSGDTATVVGLRRTPIVAQTLTPASNNGDLLTYRDGRWRAERPPTVAAIQGVPVAEPDPPPQEGQVLTVVGGEWRASGSGNAVSYVPGAGAAAYTIAAAGILSASGDGGSVYNGLQVTSTSEGQVDLEFNWPIPPGSFHTYIVKALPFYVGDQVNFGVMVTVGDLNVDSINDGDVDRAIVKFTLRIWGVPDGVAAANLPTPEEFVRQLSLMVEVSAFQSAG